MPPSELIKSAANAWMQDAHSDLALARVKKSRVIKYTHLCFHAQQAAEKAIKATLIVLDIRVPRTHDLAFLMDQMPPEYPFPIDLLEVPILSKYAVQCRYPGQELTVTKRDYDKAIVLADTMVRWASRMCRK